MNFIDSDGTLIISHGKLTGDSALAEKYAEKHGRPCLHTDRNGMIYNECPRNIVILTHPVVSNLCNQLVFAGQ